MIRNLIVPFDSGSSRSGSAQSASSWGLICEGEVLTYPRQFGTLIPQLVEVDCLRSLRSGKTPLLLGGDHSLSYYAVRAVASHLGTFTIIHFDAHHDSYREPTLNHYTVLHHIRRQTGARVVGVGYRHDAEATPSFLTERIEGPVYVSVDCDYFEPQFVRNVSHPVGAPDAFSYGQRAFADSLEMIDGPIVAADIVEWFGASSTTAEFGFMRDVYRLVSRRLNAFL